MGETIKLAGADGFEFTAYHEPSFTPRKGGVIVIQEIFGVNGHIRRITDGFARDGFLAIAPALFDRIEPGIELGYSPQDIERGLQLKSKSATENALQDIEAAREQLGRVVASLGHRYPRAAALLSEAAEDVLTYMAFPREHWQKIHSTNPLERLMREIGRRVDVVGIFPNAAAALRLIGAVLQEQEDEWRVQRRYLSMQSMAKLALTPSEPEAALVLDA